MIIEVECLEPILTEQFVTFCCNQLRVYPDLIRVEGWDEPFKNGATGLCYEVDFKAEYIIMVSTKERTVTEIYDTIAHEMVHVKQFMKQKLSKEIEQEKPIYEDRWWEKEAYEKSFSLVKKYVDTLNSLV